MGLREAVSFSVSVPFASGFLKILFYFFNVVSLIHCFYGFLLCIQHLRLLQVLSAKSRFTWWKGSLVILVLVNRCCCQSRAGQNIRMISWLVFGSLVSHSKALSHP